MAKKLQFKLLGGHSIGTGKLNRKVYKVGDIIELTLEESKAAIFVNKLEPVTKQVSANSKDASKVKAEVIEAKAELEAAKAELEALKLAKAELEDKTKNASK